MFDEPFFRHFSEEHTVLQTNIYSGNTQCIGGPKLVHTVLITLHMTESFDGLFFLKRPDPVNSLKVFVPFCHPWIFSTETRTNEMIETLEQQNISKTC